MKFQSKAQKKKKKKKKEKDEGEGDKGGSDADRREQKRQADQARDSGAAESQKTGGPIILMTLGDDGVWRKSW